MNWIWITPVIICVVAAAMMVVADHFEGWR